VKDSTASHSLFGIACLFVALLALDAQPAVAQSGASTPALTGPSVSVPADYVIGPEDVVGVMFWREPEMSGDVTVRPDGMISLPLLGDIRAVGLRPEALSAEVQKAAGRYLSDANATIVVRQINSRRVFITGEVRSPGAYPLIGPRTVLQLIALAGGLSEYADGDKITVMRAEESATRTLKFNYKEVSKGKRLDQNVLLQPGDTVVVP
jgi:polysaccharide biosynthesis/export protein